MSCIKLFSQREVMQQHCVHTEWYFGGELHKLSDNKICFITCPTWVSERKTGMTKVISTDVPSNRQNMISTVLKENVAKVNCNLSCYVTSLLWVSSYKESKFSMFHTVLLKSELFMHCFQRGNFIFFKAFSFFIFISLTAPPKREMMIMKITLQIKLGF